MITARPLVVGITYFLTVWHNKYFAETRERILREQALSGHFLIMSWYQLTVWELYMIPFLILRRELTSNSDACDNRSWWILVEAFSLIANWSVDNGVALIDLFNGEKLVS